MNWKPLHTNEQPPRLYGYAITFKVKQEDFVIRIHYNPVTCWWLNCASLGIYNYPIQNAVDSQTAQSEALNYIKEYVKELQEKLI